MSISFKERDNVEMMLTAHFCKLNYIDVLREYSFNHGGITKEIRNNITTKINSNDSGGFEYDHYQDLLRECFDAYKIEIETNFYKIENDEKLKKYFKDIYDKLNQEIEESQNILNNYSDRKPQINKLPKAFFEYFKKYNYDPYKSDNTQIALNCYAFLDKFKTEINTITNESERFELRKFINYYHGYIEKEIKLLKINIEEVQHFIDYTLKLNYTKYLPNELSNNVSEVSEINNDTNAILKIEEFNYNKEISEIIESNEFWNGVEMKKVIQHFEVLTFRNSRNGKVFLSQKQFISFLKKGFLNDENQLKQQFNYASGEKGFIIKRFYEFYYLCSSKHNFVNKKDIFIKLFLDSFDNWEETTITPFFKPNKAKQKW